MNQHDRLGRIHYVPQKEVFITPDLRGRLHKYSKDLKLLQSSPSTSYFRPINAICNSDRYIFTKDRAGAIGKWDLETLAPLDFYNEASACDRRFLFENEETSHSPARGMAYFNGKVYVNNGFTQIVVLDAETFDVVEIRQSPSNNFFDSIIIGTDELHAMSDVEGYVYVGNLETGSFPVKQRVDQNVVHCMRYDKRHDRFWTTQDGGFGEDRFVRTGIVTIEKDGTGFQEFKISHEDNEWMDFNEDHTLLYTGGFNGYISVFDNTTKEMRLKRRLGPMPFQMIHGHVVSDDEIYVLLQTGDVLCLNSKGEVVHSLGYKNACIWTMEAHPNDESLLYLATDEGVRKIRYGLGNYDTIKIDQLDKHIHGFGIVRDVKPLPDGSYVAIGRDGIVFRADETGTLIWFREIGGIPRSVSVNKAFTRTMASSDNGVVLELDIETGELVDKFEFDSPVYCATYSTDGCRLLSNSKNMLIRIFAPDSHEELGNVKLRLRIKRFLKSVGNKVYIGSGDGALELDMDTYEITKSWNELLNNSKENAVIFEKSVHVGGYGYQMASYNYDDGEIIDLQEYLHDFAKGFAGRVGEDGVPILLVGGRGAYIYAYRVLDGIPHKVREVYLQ
jgi:outer membrane protein assembly factor BamB